MKTLYGQKWYTPMEIAKQGLIQNRNGDFATLSGNYSFVLRLIKTGRLKAKNYSATKRPYYLVPESEIERYHETINNVGPAPEREATGAQPPGKNS